MSRRRQRDRNPPVAPDPGGETDHHGRLRISSSGFESWPGCHLVVAQWNKSAALRRQRPLVRVQSTRPRRHSSWEERSPGTAEVPGSAPGGGSRDRPVTVPHLPQWRLDAQRPPKPEDARSNRAGGTVGGAFDPSRRIWRVDRVGRCSLAKRRPRATSPAFDPLPLRLGRYASLAGGTLFRKQ